MTTTVTNLIARLKGMGYGLYLEGYKVKYRYVLPGNPPADKVKPLLDELRSNKEDVITHLRFKDEFNRFAEHLRQNYTLENTTKLKALSNKLDSAWNELDYPAFKGTIEEMMRIPDTMTFEDILKMPLSQFREAGLLVRVRCRHLNGEEVFIASTEKEAEIGKAEGLVCYTADELTELVKGRPSPDVMRQVHEAKKILQGTLIEAKGKV